MRQGPQEHLRCLKRVRKMVWLAIWVPNCCHLCANTRSITRPLVIKTRHSFVGHRDVHRAATQPLLSPVKRCMIAVLVPPTRLLPKLTRKWKLNNYCPILRPSYSNSHSSTCPRCYFPFYMRDPSVFRNAFIDFSSVAFLASVLLRVTQAFQWAFDFQLEWPQVLLWAPPMARWGDTRNLSCSCSLKFESKAFSNGYLIFKTGSLFNKGATGEGHPNQESEKHLIALLQSLHKNIFFLHSIPQKKPKNVSRAGANCDDSGSLNQKIAASSPFSC